MSFREMQDGGRRLDQEPAVIGIQFVINGVTTVLTEILRTSRAG